MDLVEAAKLVMEALVILDGADVMPDEIDEVVSDLMKAKEILNSPEAELVKENTGGEITMESVGALIPDEEVQEDM